MSSQVHHRHPNLPTYPRSGSDGGRNADYIMTTRNHTLITSPPDRHPATDEKGRAFSGSSSGGVENEPDGLVRNDGGIGTDHLLGPDLVATLQEALPYHYAGPSSDVWSTLAAVADNVLEWYDFALFGFFGDVLGQVFFPPQEGNAATIQSFAVFGGAFLMRPVGGMLLGYIGDMYGPKQALIISIFLMAFPTFAMGCLPSYQQIGPVAIVLLVIVRLLQGMSVGGQLISSLVYTLDSHDPAQWGLYGSFVLAAANLGTLLGAIVGTIVESVLSEEQIVRWGWRIPFMSGIVVSFSGFYLRSHEDNNPSRGKSRGGHQAVSTSDHEHKTSEEHVDGEEEEEEPVGIKQRKSGNPLVKAFQCKNLRSLLAASMVPTLWSGGFYISFVWMAIYMKKLIDPPVPHAFAVNATSLFISVCLFFPYAGILSDRYGRRCIMIVGGIGMGVLGPIVIRLIGRGNSLIAFFSQAFIGLFLSMWGAPMCAWLVESFEPEARLTSVAIGYNVAQALVGGSSPFVATWLVDRVGPNAPGLMLTTLATIALTGLVVVAPSPNKVSPLAVNGRMEPISPHEPFSERQENAIELREQELDPDVNELI